MSRNFSFEVKSASLSCLAVSVSILFLCTAAKFFASWARVLAASVAAAFCSPTPTGDEGTGAR